VKPDSSSFPSGHTASAAAFSGVIGRAYPAFWLPINALAGAIGFSRVYTGVHYPGDVLGGWLLGKSVALVVNRISQREPSFVSGYTATVDSHASVYSNLT
jgi:undecaprenyl-diphosphatase